MMTLNRFGNGVRGYNAPFFHGTVRPRHLARVETAELIPGWNSPIAGRIFSAANARQSLVGQKLLRDVGEL
jgi:hypothetical protein